MPDPDTGRVVAYVSGHGFGHAAREIEILRHLPSNIPLTVKTTSPEWFWRAEMGRPFDFVRDRFDIGCIQRDSIEIDVPATYAAWNEIARENQGRMAAEVDFLKRVNAKVVVADVPPFPLVAAAAAGIPGICVANFTWADVYSSFVGEEPRFSSIVDDLISQYQNATVCLDTALSLPMPYFTKVERVGLVARPGSSHRAVLDEQLPDHAKGKRLALIYIGSWGYPICYSRLEQFRDWHFVSLDSPPVAVGNWTVIGSDDRWRHPDLVASVDLVISKPGYGIVAECLTVGTPLLYPPRPQFAEYPALEEALTAWPGGLQIDVDRFLSLDWQADLNAVLSLLELPKVPAPGGLAAAKQIADWFRAAS